MADARPFLSICSAGQGLETLLPVRRKAVCGDEEDTSGMVTLLPARNCRLGWTESYRGVHRT